MANPLSPTSAARGLKKPCGVVCNANALHTTPQVHQLQSEVIFYLFCRKAYQRLNVCHATARRTFRGVVHGFSLSRLLSLSLLLSLMPPRFARRASRSNSTPIAFYIHFKGRRVVYEAIDCCERHSGVREDTRLIILHSPRCHIRGVFLSGFSCAVADPFD